jgi:ABC-type sugar transport system permease subunit
LKGWQMGDMNSRVAHILTLPRLQQLAKPAKFRRLLGKYAFGTLATIPAIAFLVAFIFYPSVQAVRYSTMDWIGVGPIKEYVGLENYEDIFVSGRFPNSLKVNLVFAMITVPLTVGTGFLLAAVIQRRVRGWRLFKVAWFMPVMMPGVVVAILWSSAVYAPTLGLLDSLFNLVNLPTPESGWLATPGLALLAICITAIWWSTGWAMIVLLAGMERIPQEIYEAAMIDGASSAELVRFITFPLVRPVLGAVLTLQVIFSLKVFDIVYIMTTGGPADQTLVMGLLMYRLAFYSNRFSVACAVAVLMLVIISAISLTQNRLFPIEQSV